jgi:peptide/nickel transport system substrate-binding protein
MFVALSLTTVLHGCTGGKEGESPTTKSLTAGDHTTDSEPVYGGSVTVGVQQDFDSLDPHLAGTAGTSEVLFNIFEGLVKPDTDGNLIPAVASDYDIAEDGRSYTFTLRDGIHFHNGQSVTIEDVIYSIERCAGKLEGQTEPLVSAYSVITEVQKVDERTVRLVLAEPNTELIGYLAAAIIPKGYDNQAQAPIGTGPFRFVSYSPQQSLVVEKFDDYWQDGVPYLDQVTFRIVANTDSAMMELKGGSIDIYPYLTDDQARELGGQFDVLIGSSNLVQALFLNNIEPPFDDLRVRQALCNTIDPQQIMDMVAGGNGTEIGSNMFPAFGKYYDPELAGYYEPDIAKAKELLTQAGYPDGFNMTITVPSNYQFHVDTAQVIVEQLKQINVTAKIELVEWASWYSDTYRGRKFQSTIIGLDAELAPSALLDRYGSQDNSNFVNFSDPDYDRILAEAIATVDDTVKIKNYKELQKILTEQAASVYLQDPAFYVALKPTLGGYTFYPLYVQDMAKIYYRK